MGEADDGHHRDRRHIFLVGLGSRRSRQRLHIAAHLLVFGARILPAWDENGVVRNSPPPVVYPSSLNLRPYGVSAGKSVWQVPQGCPVCRAKLGSACAGGAKPIVRKPAATATNATASEYLTLPKGRMKRPPSPRIARHPVVRGTSCLRTNTESKAAHRTTIVQSRTEAKSIAKTNPISRLRDNYATIVANATNRRATKHLFSSPATDNVRHNG